MSVHVAAHGENPIVHAYKRRQLTYINVASNLRPDSPKTIVPAATDVEGEPKKLPYPKSIGFIISNEFCERFCFYGMRSK